MRYPASLSQRDGDVALGMLGSVGEAPSGTGTQALTLVAPQRCRRVVQRPQESSRDTGHQSASACFARKHVFTAVERRFYL